MPPSLQAIGDRIDAECAAGRFSGVVIVRIAGQDVLQRACGMADIINDVAVTRDTRFKIYSDSKFITALTILVLVEDGTLSLDRPITSYLADAPSEWAGVTLRMLLNHTSGIDDLTLRLLYFYRSDHPTAMRDLLGATTPAERALKSAPGTTRRYNNFGFELLAEAAARATGTPFAELAQRKVFGPAGMRSASIEAPSIEAGHLVPVSEPGLAKGYNGERGALSEAVNWAFVQLGAGAVRASAADFIALDAALAAGKVIGRAMQDEMIRAPIAPGDGKGGAAFGLGVAVQKPLGVLMAGHTGGTNGYITDFQRFPDPDAMMIVLSNRGTTRTAWMYDEVAAALAAAR
ncbi:serine hydrolase domain-containing protein [Sphingomonas sp.]|jgi:CubicO group peptidase (beta-lactamase class C family)|uniref:serine hydrolase domain-containing protein n=1 Tax=Sphingomonas sp. TaxID=28214 RepID=UPI002609B356|nr:serine hydrolase domain-containing protein [Sphingomonas sp.]